MIDYRRFPGYFQAAGLAAGMALASVSVLQTSSAAFSVSTENSTNSFASGTLNLVDDDSASAMFNLTGLVPGDSSTECIVVDYTGDSFDVTAVKLFATEVTNVNSFADHLDVTIRQGSGGTSADCTGFTSESTIATDTPLSTLTGTKSDFASGFSTYTPVLGTTSKTFEFTVTLGTDTPTASQGDSASTTFTWEIQSA